MTATLQLLENQLFPITLTPTSCAVDVELEQGISPLISCLIKLARKAVGIKLKQTIYAPELIEVSFEPTKPPEGATAEQIAAQVQAAVDKLATLVNWRALKLLADPTNPPPEIEEPIGTVIDGIDSLLVRLDKYQGLQLTFSGRMQSRVVRIPHGRLQIKKERLAIYKQFTGTVTAVGDKCVLIGDRYFLPIREGQYKRNSQFNQRLLVLENGILKRYKFPDGQG